MSHQYGSITVDDNAHAVIGNYDHSVRFENSTIVFYTDAYRQPKRKRDASDCTDEEYILGGRCTVAGRTHSARKRHKQIELLNSASPVTFQTSGTSSQLPKSHLEVLRGDSISSVRKVLVSCSETYLSKIILSIGLLGLLVRHCSSKEIFDPAKEIWKDPLAPGLLGCVLTSLSYGARLKRPQQAHLKIAFFSRMRMAEKGRLV